ncbi:MAG: AMP-dependent synthetase [Candidatus Zixiibacteriota bacterium]|nr:MAG: AMP-dependent synthetase [candidate division Zixibacteria bacterium]
MKIYDLLEKSAFQFGERTAIIHQEERINYRELYRQYCLFTRFLDSLDLPGGSRIAILYENSINYVGLFFAISRAGFVAVPLDTSQKPDKLGYIISDCSAGAVIIQSKYHRVLKGIMEHGKSLEFIISDKEIKADFGEIEFHSLSGINTDGWNESLSPNDRNYSEKFSGELAAIFYTSGSTGTPKGVKLSHKNLLSNTYATVEYLELKPEDRIMVILPFYYIYGNSLLLTHIASGGTIVINNNFMYPELILDTMEKEKVTGFSGVPSNFMILLNKSTFSKRKLESLRYFTQAGGSMAPEIIKRLMKAFPNKQIFIMYGQTEASPRVTYLPPDRLSEKIGSIGIPIPGVDVRIMNEEGFEVPTGEVGELTVAGDNVMLGYWNKDDEENQVIKENRLYTGDFAKKDEDEYIYIIGRKKEIVKAAGNRVSTKEIEERILEHENVAEVAVLGVKDDILGEAVKAVVVLKEGCVGTSRDIQKFCREKLADFMVPKYIEFTDALPKHQSGKIDKTKLAEI